jgi:hypothetical protein
MKKFQLRIWEYERMIEWIPYDRSVNKEKIGNEDLVQYILQPG